MFTSDIICIPDILLPAKSADPAFMRAWSVIACDQFTSDRDYWDGLDAETGDAPSALRLVLPEVYLKDADAARRIAVIGENMEKYLKDGVLRRLNRGFVLTARTTAYTDRVRYGIVLAIDLEAYSFDASAKTAVRATEATVPERLPPRAAVRRGAKIELPHTMLLYNGSQEEILKDIVDGDVVRGDGDLEKLYDFELNRGGGHLCGWALGEELSREIRRRLYAAAPDGFLFAVGDGNHSLAAAKLCWEEKKKTLSPLERKTHPARYALCEAISVHSPALAFHPIHRFVAGTDAERFIGAFMRECPLPLARAGRMLSFPADTDIVQAIAFTDRFLSGYTRAYGGEIDYIHGEDALAALVSAADDRAGIRFPAIAKDGFFDYIEKNGAFPRKTFSIGEGTEKRYYTECKEI